ncbi:hypothetical protein [Nocardioides sp. CER19]|uniref:hypothetical protein n=1 Tax=Nocardioides sp. CER19 TaxID=3038538 RepID=UPI002448F945|nr:hypothetical protein [Nocardioides sp. CER19]MDH2413614.1 hypothetical protein [Nocardioides sp. CER19]
MHLWHDEPTATTEGVFRLPLLSGVKLQRMLESLLNPDRTDPIPTDDPHTGARLSGDERRGQAFIELLDRVPSTGLPTRSASWGEAHHLTAWSKDGPTDLTHGVLLCQRHHTYADHPDFQVGRLRPGRLRIHRRC